MTASNIPFEFRDVRCPVCGGEDNSLAGYRGGDAHQNGAGVKTSIVRCRECSHQYPNPMPFPRSGLEHLYVGTEEYFKNHELEAQKSYSLELITSFEERLPGKGRFLDVGCGRGELMWAATKKGWTVTGIDPSQDFLDFGRKFLGVEGIRTTLSETCFKSESFDAVAMSGIIEHLYEPLEILNEINRILRPGGWLWFDAPNEDGLYMRVGNAYMRLLGRDWVVSLAPTFPPYHVQGFNAESIRRIIQLSDFDLKDFRIHGEICTQTGKSTIRKSIEFYAAKFVNQIGNYLGMGSYMVVWAQKK